MPPIEWTDALKLNLPAMDDTHREFIDLLHGMAQSADANLLSQWTGVIAHTEAHFGMEDRWMAQTGFGSANCHSMQHDMILEVMREVSKRGAAGDLSVVRQLASELGTWFGQHAVSMDAALAEHIAHVGFDPATGHIANPNALPQAQMSGCGGASCSPAQGDTAQNEISQGETTQRETTQHETTQRETTGGEAAPTGAPLSKATQGAALLTAES